MINHRRVPGRRLLTFLLIAISFTSVAAEDMDLETAVALALDSNLGIESELLAVRQKKLIADTWWNRFYPSVNATATMARPNLEQSGFDFDTFEATEQPRWFASMGIDMGLVLTLQTIPGLSFARLDYEAGLISLADARAQVERDVSKQFYELLLLREQIALTEEQIATAERRFDQAQLNFDNGLIDEFTLLSTQVQLENLRPALTALQVGYQQTLLAFKNSIGLPLTADVTPVGVIAPPQIEFRYDEIDDARLRNRYDVQQLEQLSLILEQQRRATDLNPQGGRAPYLSFGWSLDPTFDGDPLNNDLFDTDRWEQSSGAFTITIVQPIDPWLPLSPTRNALADLERQIQQNELAIQQTRRGAEIGIRGLVLAIQTSQETIVALEENIRLAGRAFELAEIGYDNGLRDLLEVESAEVDLKDAEFQLLQEQKNIMTNLLDLAYELGTEVAEITAR